MFRFLGADPGFEPDLSKRHMLPQVARSPATARLARWSGGRRIAQKVASPALRSSIQRILYRPRRHLTLEPADRSRLVDLYRDDIRGLSALLDRDLDAWLVS
jgi:hypothetical protein